MRITCWELFECVGTYFGKAKNRIKCKFVTAKILITRKL